MIPVALFGVTVSPVFVGHITDVVPRRGFAADLSVGRRLPLEAVIFPRHKCSGERGLLALATLFSAQLRRRFRGLHLSGWRLGRLPQMCDHPVLWELLRVPLVAGLSF